MKDCPPAPGGCFWTSAPFDFSAPTKSKTNKRNSWQHRTRGELPEKQVGTRSNNHREEDEQPADEARLDVSRWREETAERCDASLASQICRLLLLATEQPPNNWKNTSFKPFGPEFFLNFNQNLVFIDWRLSFLTTLIWPPPTKKKNKQNRYQPDKKDKKCFCKSLKTPFELNPPPSKYSVLFLPRDSFN